MAALHIVLNVTIYSGVEDDVTVCWHLEMPLFLLCMPTKWVSDRDGGMMVCGVL